MYTSTLFDFSRNDTACRVQSETLKTKHSDMSFGIPQRISGQKFKTCVSASCQLLYLSLVKNRCHHDFFRQKTTEFISFISKLKIFDLLPFSTEHHITFDITPVAASRINFIFETLVCKPCLKCICLFWHKFSQSLGCGILTRVSALCE